ncbi:hypothetical protein QYF61_018895 [Mycteria americana]|uniref:Uncharacterized protein n=1 Tax=Mycteria americana TaxID=33587 RepID=A0AAN7RY43_MYCAM|nr:hypothetical protein QYF61_018895 [Mycteria americana]
MEREDQRAEPSQEEEEVVDETETTQSLSLSELQDMQKDFSHRPGEHVVTWLLQCWDNGASSLELKGKEAKQLGSLSREGDIDRAIGKRPQSSASGDNSCQTTMERGIQYLRELAMLEMIYGDLDNEQLPKDPDEVQCT